MYSNNWN